jgi:DNA (cytosine-5)-methyltransferase 1
VSTPTQPRLLDLFCGAGGATKGYQRAGFYVVGVDIKPQPRYCGDEFIQGDALTVALDGYDAIHASPPCQRFSVMRVLPQARVHPDLVAPIRERLSAAGVPWVIENVPGAPLRNPITLCGSMFGLRSGPDRYLRRHRLFEIQPRPALVPQCQHRGKAVGVYGHGSAGWLGQRMRTAKADEARVLMGMDWATRDGMSQAIPPAYTEWIGRELLRVLNPVVADV